MNKYFILISCILYFLSQSIISLKAQTVHEIDSLKRELEKKVHDTVRVELLSNISRNYWINNPDSSLNYSNKGLELAKRINFMKGQGLCLYDIAISYTVQGNYPLALKYNLQALRIFEQIRHKKWIAICLNGSGSIYNNNKDYSRALDSYMEALTILEQMHDTNTIAFAYSNIGVSYMELQNYSKAEEYLLKALKICEKTRNQYCLCVSYGNLGDLYQRQGDYSLAIEYLKKSLQLSKELQNIEGVSGNLQVIAEIYLKKGEYIKSIQFGEEALKVAQEIKSFNYIKLAANTLFEAFQKQNDFQNALKYHIIATVSNDSMINIEKQRAVSNLRQDYEMEKKQKEIELLEKDKKIAQSRSMFLGTGLFLVLVLIIIVFRSFQKERKAKLVLFEQNNEIERQKKEIECINTKLEQQTRDLIEIGEMKSKFLSTISHEFRTPLSLIIGPLTNLMNKTNEKTILKEYHLMLKHSKKLLNLINQLLELTKLQNTKIRLEISCSDINQFLRVVVSSFSSMASESRIHIKSSIEPVPLYVWFDKDKVEKIVVNLLSNAFKHTLNGGTIEIGLEQKNSEPGFIEIFVKDNGIGIEPQDLKNIFEPFYQAYSNINRKIEGSGIGLALVRELALLHKGDVSVISEVGKGAEFIVKIVVLKDLLPDAEILPDDDEKPIEITIIPIDIENTQESFQEHQSKIIKGKTTILLVEDNEDMRKFMIRSLQNKYQIIEATNGREGFDKAIEMLPDLIISDVMMPVMDGYEMTMQIKNNVSTSHIPVILLTAKASNTSKIEGLKTLADDYITKPFNIEELSLRIHNTILNRQKLREKFQKCIVVNPSEVTTSSFDEQLLTKALQIVERHMDDNEFTAEDFCSEIGMTRSSVHRKLKAIVNQSVTEFIRCIRLKRAAVLISNKTGTISEIAYQTGFMNLSYFSKSFREYFGVNPSEY